MASITAKLKIGNFVKIDTLLYEIRMKVGDYYISLDYDEMESGKCPHVRYKAEVSVEGEDGLPVSGAELSVKNSETGEAVGKLTLNGEEPVTDAGGRRTVYLPDGTYEMQAVQTSTGKNKTVTVTVKEIAPVI